MENPVATIETNKGNIVIELFLDKTPGTVDNFMKLAEKGFYNGIRFHRVIADFMIQGGCPKGNGTGGPGHNIDCELRKDLVHKRGVISMAHAGSCNHNRATGIKKRGNCSNGSQFFITHVATPHLDMVHTVFGKVTQGLDVVDAIRQGDVMNRVSVKL